MRRIFLITTALTLWPAMSAQAHPHLFVGVKVGVIYAADQPIAVQLDWFYDDFFSLLLTTDLGIDLDGDLDLTNQELVALTDAVTSWPTDFTGDLEVMQNGAPISLGPRTAHKVTYADGLITETHVRPFTGEVLGDAPLTVRAYDPFYYVAYTLEQPVTVQGRDDCEVSVVPADLDAAFAIVADLLDGRSPDAVGPDEDFPAVGAEFADTITVSCG